MDSYIESIMADTALTEANKNRGRSKKWRKMLKFPHITECQQLFESLPSKDYDFIVNRQPIGAELFKIFCFSTNSLYSRCQSFLEAVDAYELYLENAQMNSSDNIVRKFLT